MDARETALHVWTEIEEKGVQSRTALEEAFEKNPELTQRDQRLVRRLVLGTLEKKLQLDFRINQKSRTPVEKMRPLIRSILRLSAYQLFYMDRIPDSAVCSEALKLTEKCHMPGLKGFVNGVLRAMAREENWQEEPDWLSASVPEWIWEGWKREHGESSVQALAESLKRPENLTIRRVSSRVTQEELERSLARDGASVRPAPFPETAGILRHEGKIEDLAAYREGWFLIQDISSMLVETLAGIQPGFHVLDVCAAPGGKSLDAADRLAGTGEVIACDRTEEKVSRIRDNVRRLRLDHIRPLVRDAEQFVPEWENAMDVVLADLPCSGLGVLGRRPDLRYRMTPEQIPALAAQQRRILANVWRYVRPGGILMYSTCTVTREENGDNRLWALSHLPLEPAGFAELLPEALAGETTAAEGFLQLLPGIHPCDGFYIAKFRRRTR